MVRRRKCPGVIMIQEKKNSDGVIKKVTLLSARLAACELVSR